MHIQLFAATHEWRIIGEGNVQKDQFARYYIDGARVNWARQEGVFTTLICADGRYRFVMTSDWAEVQRMGGRSRSDH